MSTMIIHVRVPLVVAIARSTGAAICCCAAVVPAAVLAGSDPWFGSGALDYALGIAFVAAFVAALSFDILLKNSRRLELRTDGVVYYGALGPLRGSREQLGEPRLEPGRFGGWRGGR